MATDLVGTPRIILDSTGKVLAQPVRTPFGALIEQPVKDDPVSIPVGFYGGIEDIESGVVIMRSGKPYDSHLGQWMVPQLDQVLEPGFEDPTRVHGYRFANNDPINPEEQTRTFSYMNSLDEWLEMFGIDPPSTYLNTWSLPESAKLFGRSEIEPTLGFVGHRRRPKLFSDFYTEPEIFGGRVHVELHRSGGRRVGVGVEDPEFFHRKISATKLSDGADAEHLAQLLDRVSFFVIFWSDPRPTLCFFCLLEQVHHSLTTRVMIVKNISHHDIDHMKEKK